MFLTGSEGNVISGSAVGPFVRASLPWICCKLCQIAAECSCAFRRSSATLAVNKTSRSDLTSFSSVSLFPFPVKLGELPVKTEETGVEIEDVTPKVSERPPNLGGQQGQGKPPRPEKTIKLKWYRSKLDSLGVRHLIN